MAENIPVKEKLADAAGVLLGLADAGCTHHHRRGDEGPSATGQEANHIVALDPSIALRLRAIFLKKGIKEDRAAVIKFVREALAVLGFDDDVLEYLHALKGEKPDDAVA